MKILFISGVKLGLDSLNSLLAAGENICGIITYSDSHSDRSGYLDFSSVNKKHPNIPIIKSDDLKNLQIQSQILSLKPDLILVIGYSFLIPNNLLSIAKYGAIGHHPTLLPKHRGNAPIPWTLINGLTKSGITFFYLSEEIDQGMIAAQSEFSISMDDDASSLYSKITSETISLLPKMLSKIKSGTLVPIPQDNSKSSKWSKRKPEDGIIDWNSMSIYLYNWIRGLTHPYPGAFTFFQNKKLLIWKSIISQMKSAQSPGTIISTTGGLFVSTGDGVLEILSLSFETDAPMSALVFIKKYSIEAGMKLG